MNARAAHSDINNNNGNNSDISIGPRICSNATCRIWFGRRPFLDRFLATKTKPTIDPTTTPGPFRPDAPMVSLLSPPLGPGCVNELVVTQLGGGRNLKGATCAQSYNAIIKANNLDLHYKSVTFGTFGSFGAGTWAVITKACDPSTHPKGLDDFNPWNAPGPKRDFVLSLGFALQRANSRMLRGADRRRRNARGCDQYSSGTRPSSSSSEDDYWWRLRCM